MAVNPSPWGPCPQFELSDGTPAVGCRLFAYVAGSVGTKQNTYTDSTGGVANANPVVLNALGMPTTEWWWTAGQTYKVVYAPPGTDDPPNSPIRTWDNLKGENDVTAALDQWITGPTPTFVSTTSFTLVGDQTTAFHVGRRVKTSNSGGTIYSTITVSAFAALTTITVANDSGVLDSGLSSVSYGLLSDTNHSVPSFQAKGDLLTQSAAGTISRLAVGANGTIPMARSAATSGLAYVAALTKAIYGLTYDVGTDTTNDININVGGAIDATGAYWMTLATALGKQSDVVWAVGGTTAAPVGWLDSGAVGNNDYYIWLIARSDTGVVDSLCSLSSTAPTMPAQYDFKRLIGWFKRSGGAIVSFNTYETEGSGLDFVWKSPPLDINLANTLTTTARTDTMSVPTGFSVFGHFNVTLFDASSAASLYMSCPDSTDLAVNPDASPGATLKVADLARTCAQAWVRTSSTGTIRSRSDLATVDLYVVTTLRFQWSRR